MADFQYKRAPITEAVVEIKSATPIDKRKRNKAVKKLNKFYSHHDPVTQQNFEVNIKPGGTPRIQTTDSVLDKFSSEEMTQQLHISDTSFVVSRLAPYTGWEKFKLRIMRDWDTWRSAVGFYPIKRVGMRYINRIDLPITGPIVRYEDYLRVYPSVPPLLDPCVYHSVNVRVMLRDIDSILNLKSAQVESPLPGNLAIVLDLDILRNFKSSPSNEELYSFISRARIKKNEIFEACITDKARNLFNQ